MLLTGSQIVAECLIEQGVDTVFGYPGGTILNIYDALYQYQDKIHHILTSHEQGAAHAAALNRKGWSVYGDFWAGSYEPGYRDCYGLHGFNAISCNYC